MMVNKKQNESILVCEAQKGRKEALQQLLTRNWSWLKGIVYNVAGNADELDDIMQDICIKVITKIDTLNEPECFRPWLAVLARRQALQYRRKKARKPLQLSEEIIEQKCDEKNQLFENIEEKERYKQLMLAIYSLPEKYREVFMLQHSGDVTYGQIAEILDVPVTTVQIRLVRARRMLYDKIINRDEDKVLEK
jgi:RNA polymerase sigma-70 factor (ECF subfamily)